MHKKINEEINAVLSFIFLHNITQSIVPNIEKLAIQQTVLEQTAVIVKYKFIKCKQSVEGSIISQILKLPYWYGDVNEMEINFTRSKKRTIWHEILSVQQKIPTYI